MCSKENCNNKSYSSDGLCQKHQKLRAAEREKENPKEIIIRTEFCIVENCQEKTRYINMCGKHYKRKWRHGDPNTTLIDMEPKIEKCKIDSCENIVKSHKTDYCHLHWQRDFRYGRTENIIATKGEGSINSYGYRVISVNGKVILEHIYLAEKALGKKLPPKAIVHHMNRKPADNFTPFNLIICPDQAYHLLLHRRMVEFGYNNSEQDRVPLKKKEINESDLIAEF